MPASQPALVPFLGVEGEFPAISLARKGFEVTRRAFSARLCSKSNSETGERRIWTRTDVDITRRAFSAQRVIRIQGNRDLEVVRTNLVFLGALWTSVEKFY